ncbi:hypothetical protein MLD52_09730 [Puniceicoccaceae bacterium K14]|nr:hypothetical protein [Puniceicoccaceae bacterium K14]
MRKGKTVVIWSILAIWAGVITVPMSLLMASHMVAFNTPNEIVDLHYPRNSEGEWSLNHVLSGDCKCSLGVADYLVTRRKQSGIRENIVLMNGTDEMKKELIRAGFTISSVDSEELCQQYGSLGVPYYQVVTPNYDLYHSSGYFLSTDRTQRTFDDLSALEKAQGNESLEEHSFYGCATSIDLKESINPFNF